VTHDLKNFDMESLKTLKNSEQTEIYFSLYSSYFGKASKKLQNEETFYQKYFSSNSNGINYLHISNLMQIAPYFQY